MGDRRAVSDGAPSKASGAAAEEGAGAGVRPLRIFIGWRIISGYMAACWRALDAREDVEVFVVCRRGANFDPAIVEGLEAKLLDEDEPLDERWMRSEIGRRRPDALLISGWSDPAYRGLATSGEASGAIVVMGMDTPWTGSLRQRLGRFRHPKFFRRVDRAWVAGERAWQLARTLGFEERRIFRGVYAADVDAFAAAHQRRRERGGWPRRFLFVARYVAPKAIDVLCDGYARYRRSVADPWPLTACGAGPLADLIARTEGVEDRGFVQPADLPEVFAEHGVFVLASRYEPWGVVVAEAAASGLPVVCTESVCSSLDLVRSRYNGVTVPTDDAASLARAFRWMHEHESLLPEMGDRARAFAAAYSPEMWAERLIAAVRSAMEDRSAAAG